MKISTTIDSIKTFFSKNKTESVLLALLLITAAILRFGGLGFSDYYGDEAKTLYWNKTVPAQEFLLNQRKGPVQFVAAWFMEKASGGFDEGAIRTPFALAGFLAIPVLYLLLRRKFGVGVALLGAFLFSINGLYIAFSRIVQYQSLLVLFGLLALLFLDFKGRVFTVLAGFSLGLAFLSHYDAVFFLVPALLLLWREVEKREWFWFLLPLLVLVLSFYLPYVLGGYFTEHTTGYLERRLMNDVISSSNFTYLVYNPFVLGLAPFVFFAIPLLQKKKNSFVLAIIAWFFIALVFFEFVISSPGTHIHNYVLPLIILSSVGLVAFIKNIRQRMTRNALFSVFGLVFALSLAKQVLIFTPALNFSYPWTVQKVSESKNQRFLYGFPYKRGWDQIEAYLRNQGARSFYTTDNVTIAEFYLRGIPSDVATPHYFVHAYDNQNFHEFWSEVWLNDDPSSGIPERIEYKKVVLRRDAAEFFDLVETIEVDGEVTALVYKRVDPVE